MWLLALDSPFLSSEIYVPSAFFKSASIAHLQAAKFWYVYYYVKGLMNFVSVKSNVRNPNIITKPIASSPPIPQACLSHQIFQTRSVRNLVTFEMGCVKEDRLNVKK